MQQQQVTPQYYMHIEHCNILSVTTKCINKLQSQIVASSTTNVVKSVQVIYSQFCIPDDAEASAGAASGLGNLTGPTGDAGLEVVVVTQVPLGAFQCTGTGPDSAEVMPAA